MMEVVLPQWDSLELHFAKVMKPLKDANSIAIDSTNDSPLLDTRVYEVEYSNTFATKEFGQIIPLLINR